MPSQWIFTENLPRFSGPIDGPSCGCVADGACLVRDNGSFGQYEMPNRPESRRCEKQQRQAQRCGIGPTAGGEVVTQDADQLRCDDQVEYVADEDGPGG